MHINIDLDCCAKTIDFGLIKYIPGPNVLSPSGKGFPHPEPGEGPNLDELVEVCQITDPLVQVCELRLTTSYHTSHSLETECGVVRLVHLGIDYHPEKKRAQYMRGRENEEFQYNDKVGSHSEWRKG